MMADNLTHARSLIEALGLTASDAAERCPGCRALVPASPGGPVHRSIGASPRCWAIYTALLASEFSAFDARTHQLSVDSYAAQHPGEPSSQAIQSVCTHLVALCLSLEHGFGVEDHRPLMDDLSDGRWFAPRWLEPPTMPWRMTVIDLLDADTSDGYETRVREWSEVTWAAWSARQAQVREWARAILTNRRDG